MRWELLLFLVAGIIMSNIYTDGKVLKQLFSWKKYYQMIGVFIGACAIFWLFKKDPYRASKIIQHSNEYLKYLPIDKDTSSIISPILDFTSKHPYLDNIPQGNSGNTSSGNQYSMLNMFRTNPMDPPTSYQKERLMSSGKKATKRSVSETKKKFVASNQNWKCGDCQEQLSAWYEIDHKTRLEYGGSNDINNLVALCRECHGRKTTIENL
jgi:5-methylcytosine-specific restriction endonuclease McrA